MLRAKYYFCYALICNSLELTEGVLSFCLDCIIKGLYNNNDLVKIFQIFFFFRKYDFRNSNNSHKYLEKADIFQCNHIDVLLSCLIVAFVGFSHCVINCDYPVGNCFIVTKTGRGCADSIPMTQKVT